MEKILPVFVTAPKGVAGLLREELDQLGLSALKESPAGVAGEGSLSDIYRVCLWSRLANRVLLPLAKFPVSSADALYDGALAIAWHEHFSASHTFVIDANVRDSVITHSQYAALRVKDAVADYFRRLGGSRPSVERDAPDIRINVFIDRAYATISLDLSGDSLHQRGYRAQGGAAPLKENLAAAILLRSGWPAMAAAGKSLVDPMCGSGTLLIEAAWMAGDRAPGLMRERFGFHGWLQHDAALWEHLRADTLTRADAGHSNIPPIFGFDVARGAVELAKQNAKHAGVQDVVSVAERAVRDLLPPVSEPGLLVTNPPYGERLGDVRDLETLYAELGARLRDHFANWQAAVFTGNPDAAKAMPLRARKHYALFNGAIPCRLLLFTVTTEWLKGQHAERVAHEPKVLSSGAQMFANRLRKNLKHHAAWAKKAGVDCYRVYDADMPEYAFAIDLYAGDERWAHVQEYAPPATIEEERAEARRRDVLAALPEALDLPRERIFVKTRQRQRQGSQYEKQDARGEYHIVKEGGLKFYVNFTDYLDTGIFLDHRITRSMVRDLAAKQHVLNLFGYTGSATVYAAAGGARSTLHVDMSRTYIEWAQRNMALNGFTGKAYAYEQADVLQWLEEAGRDPRYRGRFGLIFLDPPTFSRSKRMQQTMDIQRDHVDLIRGALALMAPAGVLLFSTNAQRFKMAAGELADCVIEDITAATLPEDYARNPRVHYCFMIRRGEKNPSEGSRLSR